MCRHLAYLGPEEPLGRLLVDPAHSLYRQSWAPRRQRYGTVNADGFGVGWYAEGDPVPGRYRRTGPIWGDQSFADLARVVRSGALLAAVRDATLAGADGEAAAAPFAAGTWLFSHNGAIMRLAALPGPARPDAARRRPAVDGGALRLGARLGAGPEPAAGRRRGGPGARRHGPGGRGGGPGSRLNLLLTNGEAIAATAWGDTLWYLTEPGKRTVVASEPYDDDPHWREVPDRTLLAASRNDVLLTPLKDIDEHLASVPNKEPRT